MRLQKFDIKKVKKMPKRDCVICKGGIGDEDIVFENDDYIAFLDLHPPTKGYTIVAPKKHFKDVSALSEEEYLEFQRLVLQISKSIKKAFKPKRVCLLNSGGLLEHLHFHIIPMYKDVYSNFMDVLLKKSVLQISKIERKKISKVIRNNLIF